MRCENSRETVPFCQEWLDLYKRLKGSGRHGELSLFFGASLARGRVRVLVVGKSTYGWEQQPEGAPNRYSEEFLRVNLRSYHLDGCDHAGCEQHRRDGNGRYHSHFWRFAIDLVSTLTPDPGCPFDRLAWTNLAKIAPACRGNARSSLFAEQRELAVRTLQSEIEFFQPKLVVFTTMGYFDEATVRALDIGKGMEEMPRDGACMWLASRSCRPAVLVTKHPQGKPRELKAAWLAKANKLVRGDV